MKRSSMLFINNQNRKNKGKSPEGYNTWQRNMPRFLPQPSQQVVPVSSVLRGVSPGTLAASSPHHSSTPLWNSTKRPGKKMWPPVCGKWSYLPWTIVYPCSKPQTAFCFRRCSFMTKMNRAVSGRVAECLVKHGSVSPSQVSQHENNTYKNLYTR